MKVKQNQFSAERQASLFMTSVVETFVLKSKREYFKIKLLLEMAQTKPTLLGRTG